TAWRASAAANGCWWTWAPSSFTSCSPRSGSTTTSRSCGRRRRRCGAAALPRARADGRSPMKLVVVAVGHRMPAWVDAGFIEYAERMPREARVELAALKPAPRGGPLQRMLDAEGERILAKLPGGCVKVVLDERGTLIRTTEL